MRQGLVSWHDNKRCPARGLQPHAALNRIVTKAKDGTTSERWICSCGKRMKAPTED